MLNLLHFIRRNDYSLLLFFFVRALAKYIGINSKSNWQSFQLFRIIYVRNGFDSRLKSCISPFSKCIDVQYVITWYEYVDKSYMCFYNTSFAFRGPLTQPSYIHWLAVVRFGISSQWNSNRVCNINCFNRSVGLPVIEIKIHNAQQNATN